MVADAERFGGGGGVGGSRGLTLSGIAAWACGVNFDGV